MLLPGDRGPVPPPQQLPIAVSLPHRAVHGPLCGHRPGLGALVHHLPVGGCGGGPNSPLPTVLRGRCALCPPGDAPVGTRFLRALCRTGGAAQGILEGKGAGTSALSLQSGSQSGARRGTAAPGTRWNWWRRSSPSWGPTGTSATRQNSWQRPFTSPRHLRRGVKRVYGKPLYQCVRNYKMDLAAVVLQRSNRTVTDIAGEFGYDNSSKFAAAFRAALGCSPADYRRKAPPPAPCPLVWSEKRVVWSGNSLWVRL